MLSEKAKTRIGKIREFNRFYTRIIGVLREGLLHSPYSLTEARVIFEIAHRDNITATNLCREIGLDHGYLSRILSRFEKQKIIERIVSVEDKRHRFLSLTDIGRKAFEQLDSRSSDEIADLLNNLDEMDQLKLLGSMNTIESILDKELKYANPFILRYHRPGDMGWITYRHGILYSQEYGWNEEFEAAVAQIVADFVKNYNPDRERCWIAEMGEEPVGSVFIVQENDETAKLRLLLVEPKARGLGLGNKLVEECVRFSRQCGYKKIVLWTNSVLLGARRIYEKNGFTFAEQDKHHSYGHDLIGETWELIL